MAIIFNSVQSNPTDNGSNSTDNVSFINPSTIEGDLCIIIALCRTASATITIGTTGGQTWNALGNVSSVNATLSANVFWCRFNGTWSPGTTTFPIVHFGATTNNTQILLTFRPTSGSNIWATDPAQVGAFVDKAVASAFTITGWTPNNASNVNIGISMTDDDNTWTISGANWINTSLSAQYRNTAGSDTSASIAYQIQTAAAATNNLVLTEATLGNDGGFTFAICFYEKTASTNLLPFCIAPQGTR